MKFITIFDVTLVFRGLYKSYLLRSITKLYSTNLGYVYVNLRYRFIYNSGFFILRFTMKNTSNNHSQL